jgi:hypothetical protein
MYPYLAYIEALTTPPVFDGSTFNITPSYSEIIEDIAKAKPFDKKHRLESYIGLKVQWKCALSNFQEKGKPLLQSFLLGQEELQPILRAPNMEQFRQRIVASCHLVPLTDSETQEYIEYRLSHAGWDGEKLFSDLAYEKIYQFTHGVPRKINTLMDRIMLYGFLEELKSLDENAVENVIKEVSDEMFDPAENNEEEISPDGLGAENQSVSAVTADPSKDVQYYKTMLTELTDALDDAISHKIKLTRYIDKLLKEKYKTYVRLKSDD